VLGGGRVASLLEGTGKIKVMANMAVVFVFAVVFFVFFFHTLMVSDDVFCYHAACFLCPTDGGEPFVDIHCTHHTICVPFILLCGRRLL